MAEAVVNQDTEITPKGPGVFNQAGSLVCEFSVCIRNLRFSAPSHNGCIDCWHRWISGLLVHAA